MKKLIPCGEHGKTNKGCIFGGFFSHKTFELQCQNDLLKLRYVDVHFLCLNELFLSNRPHTKFNLFDNQTHKK